MARKVPEYIVVEGPVGVGKSSLAKRLALTFNKDLLLERPADNPFLPRFYEDRKSAALPTQLHFLFQRVKQLESLRQTDMFKSAQVANFLIQKDQLFAQVTLDKDELELYYQVYNRLTLESPIPDLVIYLQAPVEVLLKRVYDRGVDYEKNIDEEYLRRVVDAYIEFFYHYNSSPLLIVNTSEFEIGNESNDYDILINYIYNITSGRHYLNPGQI